MFRLFFCPVISGFSDSCFSVFVLSRQRIFPFVIVAEEDKKETSSSRFINKRGSVNPVPPSFGSLSVHTWVFCSANLSVVGSDNCSSFVTMTTLLSASWGEPLERVPYPEKSRRETSRGDYPVATSVSQLPSDCCEFRVWSSKELYSSASPSFPSSFRVVSKVLWTYSKTLPRRERPSEFPTGELWFRQ